MYRLGYSWPIFVFHSEYNEEFVKKVLENASSTVNQFYFIKLPYDVDDIASYNRLMKSPWLWEVLQDYKIDKVLIFQSDSIMLHGNISPFLRFDVLNILFFKFSV